LAVCFCVVLSCVGRGFCDGLITCPMSPTKCLPVWGVQGPYKDCWATDDVLYYILVSWYLFLRWKCMRTFV
jgi:hypothetical protein